MSAQAGARGRESEAALFARFRSRLARALALALDRARDSHALSQALRAVTLRVREANARARVRLSVEATAEYPFVGRLALSLVAPPELHVKASPDLSKVPGVRTLVDSALVEATAPYTFPRYGDFVPRLSRRG